MVFEAMLRVGALLQAPAIASGSTEMASVYYLSKYISKGSTDDKRKYATWKFHDPARAGWKLGTKGKCKGSRKRCPRCPMRVCNCSRLHMFKNSQYTDSLLRISNRLLRMCGLTQAKVCFWLRVISESHCMSILCGRSRRSVSPLKIRTTRHT